MPLVSYAQYKLCQDEFVISLSILQKEINKLKSRLIDKRILKFFSIDEENSYNSVFSLERDEKYIMEVCKRVENILAKLQIKQFSPIIWKLLYKDSIPNNIKESFDLFTNSIPVDYYLKKDGYTSKKGKKIIKHVINKKEIAKKNYVIDNIINIPEKTHESPNKDLGKWSRSARDLFTNLNDSPGPGSYYVDEINKSNNNNNETQNTTTFGTSERSNFEIISYEEGEICPRLKDGYIHESHRHNNNKNKNNKISLFSLMNKNELNWGENDEEWNELFNNMLENMKQEYYEKYGIECKIFDLNLENEMSEEEKERLITELRDWIKNGKGDLLTFFQTYFKDMRPSQILQYLDLLESLLPDNSTRCVICFRMIDEHNIEELTDCISVHQTILQEIYKARLQKKVVNIWLNKNEEREMKEKSGEIPKSIGNKIKSKLNKIRRKNSVLDNNNDNTHEDIQMSVKSDKNKNVEKKEEEADKKENKESKKNKKKKENGNKKKKEKEKEKEKEGENKQNIKEKDNNQSNQQSKSNPYAFFNADEKNIETIISENNKNSVKLFNTDKQKKMNNSKMISVESLLKQQQQQQQNQSQQNFSPIPKLSPNITLNTPINNSNNNISTPFSFSDEKNKKINNNNNYDNLMKEKRFKTSTTSSSTLTTKTNKRKSRKSKKSEKDDDNNGVDDYDVVAEAEITENWEYYVCDMKNTNKILCKQCKKKILSHSYEELIVCSGKIKESKKYLKFITTLKRQENERKMKEKNSNNKKNNTNNKTNSNKTDNNNSKAVKEKSKMIRTLSTETYDTYDSEMSSTPSQSSLSSSTNAYFKFNDKDLSKIGNNNINNNNNKDKTKNKPVIENNNNDISITPMLKPKRLLETMNNVDTLTPSSSSYSTNNTNDNNSLITPSSSSNRSMRLSQIYKNTILNEQNNNNKPPTSKHSTVNSIKPILNEQKSNHHQPSPLINEYISKSNSNSTPNTPNDKMEVDKYGNTLYIPPQLGNTEEKEEEEESKNRFLIQLNKLQMKKSKTTSIGDINNNNNVDNSFEKPKTTTHLQQNEQNAKILKSKRVEQLITEETPIESMKQQQQQQQTFKYNKNNSNNSQQIQIPNNEKHGRDSIFKIKLAAELSNNSHNNNNYNNPQPPLLSVRSNPSPSSKSNNNITTAPSRIISTPIATTTKSTTSSSSPTITTKSMTTTNQSHNNNNNSNYSYNKNNKVVDNNDTASICPFCKKQIAQHSYDELENCLAKEDQGIESNSGIDITDICMTCHTLLSSHTIPKLEKCIEIQENLIEEAKIQDTVALDRYNKYKKRIKEQQERSRKEKQEMQKQSIRN